MVYCPSCGEPNEDNARFCRRCGRALPSSGQFDQKVQDFAQEMEALGKKAADMVESGMREMGREWSEKRAPFKTSNWSDTTMGLAGPLVWSLLGLLVLLLVIPLFMALGDQGSALENVADFLLRNIWLIFIFSLLLSYATYASRNYRLFRWLTPLSAAAGLVFALWIAVEVMIIISVDQNIDVLGDVGRIIRHLLAFAFVVLLVVGYLALVLTASRPAGQEDARTRGMSNGQAPNIRSGRLYRSAENRMLGGVCGGIAEYSGTDPTLIRILWIIVLFLSFGLAILAYIICWIVIPRNPSQRWA